MYSNLITLVWLRKVACVQNLNATFYLFCVVICLIANSRSAHCSSTNFIWSRAAPLSCPGTSRPCWVIVWREYSRQRGRTTIDFVRFTWNRHCAKVWLCIGLLSLYGVNRLNCLISHPLTPGYILRLSPLCDKLRKKQGNTTSPWMMRSWRLLRLSQWGREIRREGLSHLVFLKACLH